MDPISIVSAVVSTALTIQQWIDQSKSRNTIIRELSTTVSRISTILSPLFASLPSNDSTLVLVDAAAHLDTTTLTCLQDMGEVLGRTQDHLSLWSDKRRGKRATLLSFLSPSTVINELRDDEKILTQRLSLLSFALQVFAFRAAQLPLPTRPVSTLDLLRSAEVKRFWVDKIGGDVFCCSGKQFCVALSHWINIHLDETTCDTLLLRLDEFAVGGVTPSSLDRFVGRQTLREAIGQLGIIQGNQLLIQLFNTMLITLCRWAGTRFPVSVKPIELRTVRPLIVWIDDVPDNNEYLIDSARALGIIVIKLTSTAAAKVWINANDELLRRTDRARRLRFISDNARWESHPQSPSSDLLNLSAGETILRYLRGRQYTSPVLIYCGASIMHTQYVLRYTRAGSTVSSAVCKGYIEALLQRSDWEDESWASFDVQPAISA
ncbi:hypothetical protein EW146_g7054 [Bondarzewia mesenterica]|uniref:Uncharacterized protein n=1 Tax=Bondarzewia mesenterica TaxID=1095465 RepID=A0A4S4LMI3_9AGAM|nr:hypothetical protein EW146_g7054 [Bondarzewia mesenterica]